MTVLPVPEEARRILELLNQKNPALKFSPEYIRNNVQFEGGDLPVQPGALKSGACVSAAFAALGAVADQIAQIRYGGSPSKVNINTDHAGYFLAVVSCFEVEGRVGRANIPYAPDWEDAEVRHQPLYKAATALYKTKDDRWFQLHGDLDASVLLKDIGLGDISPQQEPKKATEILANFCRQHTADELEAMMVSTRHSGSKCYEPKEWLTTEMGQALAKRPLIDVSDLAMGKPTAFPASVNKRILEGIKVVEMVRIIAAPTIGRTLAEFGAQVIRVNAPQLRDLTILQYTLTTGSHTIKIDARQPDQKAQLESLVAEADVFIQGYRPGSIDRLGFSKERVLELVQTARGKDAGIIYVDENTYGNHGPYAGRTGWQQIADAASGASLVHSRSVGHADTVVLPPLPISDLVTGVLGATSILCGLRERALRGGSYHIIASLTAYDMFCLSDEVGVYPQEVVDATQAKYKWKQAKPSQNIWEVMDDIMECWKQANPDHMNMQNSPFFVETSSGPFGRVHQIAPVARIDQYPSKWDHPPRPYCYDEPTFAY